MKTRFGVLLVLALALSGCGVSPTGVSSGASSDTTTTRVSPAVEVEAELEFEQALERERYMEEVLAPSSSAAQLPEGAIFWTEAWGYVGMSGTLCGPVVNGFTAFNSNGQPTFLDIGASYPSTNRVTVVIWGENMPYFATNPATALPGRDVCVSGDLYEYDGVLQLEVWTPEQIAVKS